MDRSICALERRISCTLERKEAVMARKFRRASTTWGNSRGRIERPGFARTCKYLRTLKVLIGMEITWGEGEIDPNQQENQVGSSPHGLDCWRAARRGQQAHAAAAAGDTRKRPRARDTGDMAMGSATGGYLGVYNAANAVLREALDDKFVSADCLIRRDCSGVRTRQ